MTNSSLDSGVVVGEKKWKFCQKKGWDDEIRSDQIRSRKKLI